MQSGQVVMIFAPVLNHTDRSDQTHQAAECAAEQDRFWEMHDLLFEHQDQTWSGDVRTAVKQIAADAGFDTAAFNTCIDEQRHLARIEAQDQIRVQAGIRGQPVFFINGDFLVGAQPYETFANVIDSKLSQ